SLIRLRKFLPNADALRVPFARILSIVGVVICLALMTGLTRRAVLAMGVTSLIAAGNWLWAKWRRVQSESHMHAQAQSSFDPEVGTLGLVVDVIRPLFNPEENVFPDGR